MRENLFRFIRGTAHLFYEDLAGAANFPGGPVSWIRGDLHLENFGSFRADNNQVYFDLNDFDEAILAPISWEIVRLLDDRYRDMYSVIHSMGILAASSHIRSGGQDGSCITDELKAFGRRDDWQDAVFAYARDYANRMKGYYQAFHRDVDESQCASRWHIIRMSG